MITFIKKALTISLCFLVVFMTAAPIFAVENTTDYSTHWAKENIQTALDTGMATGYPDGSFKPDRAITRAEFVTMVNNKFKFIDTAEPTFSDVAADVWYAAFIDAAIAEGYITGYTDETVKPDASITRQEAAVIFNILNELTAISDTPDFTDAALIAEWGKDAIIAVSEKNIMIGYPDGSFRPDNQITRAEAILAITNSFNFSEMIVDETVAPVELGLAGNFVILSKTGISTIPNSSITGDIGVSPIVATGITGFSLTADATNVFSTSDQVIGKIYAATFSAPTPSNLTTAISNMETAYTDAAGRAADYTELHAGDISGKTLTPGVYKWGTGIVMNTDVTLEGDADDVWIFQIGEGITQANGVKIILKGGAQAKNIIWQAAQTVSIGTGSHFEGIVLTQTNITLGTGASINGRLLAQTAVTLDQSIVVGP
ncbi:MAG: DUF3494 domain-containing protein [Clostridia bacterium]|nr:DUF3494 domain-containing protein [Clostridia bacterium]